MRAPSAEEQEEAPTAKKAIHDELIRVRARDGEEVTLSCDAARLMGTLKDLMDLATSDEGMYPMPTILASTLQMVCKLNDPDYIWPSSDEHSLLQLIQLIEDALYLDASIALKHTQRVIASRLNGKRAPELCALIGADGDFGSAEEHAASIAEPAFVPEDVEAPQQPASSTLLPKLLQQPSFTADAMEAALGLVDVATLAELKGVTRSWRALAQCVLCSRLCGRDGQPVPTRLVEITDLDVEQLIEAGRPGDVAIAGRMLPGLARIHGYGYVVDVAAVRAADLRNRAGDRRRPSLLHGATKDALNSCISGEGEPPLELTIASVACAGSGVVCGIPVQQMREDGVTELDLSNRGLRVAAAMLVAYLIPATSVLKNCNLLKNSLDVKSATMLAKIGTEKGIMLSGMTRDQTKADLSSQNLQPADTILIASDLQFTAVLTSLNLGLNNMDNDGAKAIAGALSSGTVVLDKLDVGYNSLNEQAALGIVRAAQQQDKITFLGLGGCGIGPIGAKEIADYIQFTAVLAELQLSANNIGDNGAIAIADALKSGTTVLTNLGLSSNNIGPEGAKAIADALQSGMSMLTKLSLEHNNIGPEGAKAIAGALKSGKAVLTTLFLNNNKIDDDGAMAIAGALFSGTAVLIKLVLWHNNLGNAGEKAMRDAVKGRIGFDLKM